MLKKIQLYTSREETLWFSLGSILLFRAFLLVKDLPTVPGYHEINWLFALIFVFSLFTIGYGIHLYLKQEYENATAKFYNNVNECRPLLLRKFRVVHIIKRYSKDPCLVIYDVFFEETNNDFFSKIINPRHILRVSTQTKHGINLLRSSIFKFSEEGRNLAIDNLDKDNLSKDYTRVPVKCEPGVKLHLKSVSNFEYIFEYLHD